MDQARARQLAGGAAAGIIGGGLLLAAVSMAASIVDRADVPVEMISGRMVTLAVGAAILVATGVLYLALTKNRDLVLLSGAAALLLLASVAGMFSIGLLVLPFAVGAIYLVARRSKGRQGIAAALLAGPAIAAGLSLLLIIWVQPPVVECLENGVATNSRPWWDSGSSSGEGASRHSQFGESVSTGTLETPEARYVYRCTDGKLTQFRPIAGRP